MDQTVLFFAKLHVLALDLTPGRRLDGHSALGFAFLDGGEKGYGARTSRNGLALSVDHADPEDGVAGSEIDIRQVVAGG